MPYVLNIMVRTHTIEKSTQAFDVGDGYAVR